ncbi:MAG: threonine/serine exporter family protein, partial [Peptococcaceae bacterium]|nr:threonine/serine exporter family protein [Peptococcaceae bacterium]
ITNAMRDIIAGDLLAGTMKAVEAMLVALALAIGTGIVLILTGGM